MTDDTTSQRKDATPGRNGFVAPGSSLVPNTSVSQVRWCRGQGMISSILDKQGLVTKL